MRNLILPVVFILSFLTACDKNNNFVLFSVEDDVALGQQVNEEIQNDPQFDVLSDAEYPQAYQYIRGMLNDILTSDEIAYKDEFPWQIQIIRNDTTLNAFAAPGGYLYVYTGLIKYLDNADALAGVLAHEVAHADLRHTSRNLQRAYGIQVLLSIALGADASQLEAIAGQIAGTLAGLSFSREFEKESDNESVHYLSDTKYACNGAGLFFQKLENAGGGTGTPEFLSTHPSPDNRIEKINNTAQEINCDTSLVGDTNYEQFKNWLSN
ncbi:MAG: M48 family metalloprotease [Candidatus Cyclobacteriaceae bacterium M2_1C_046]